MITSRYTQTKKILWALNSVIPDAQKREAIYLLRSLLLLEPDRVKRESAVLSGIPLRDILVIGYDDKLD